MKKFSLSLLLITLAFTLFGQQKTVTGVVTSAADDLPVIGASIQVKGTTRGAVTDIDGNYNIQVSNNETLVFSYVGMRTVEEPVGTRTVINVVMPDDTEMLDEVVVTAMGVRTERAKLNFAVSTLRADELKAGETQNFVNNLQGKIAGVNVTTAGGSPNSGSQVLIRGISSINPSQNNQPLYIIDGMAVRGSGSNMIDINPNDIADVTVLKGAAASALYGQEAANGVIMITTKSGQSGAFTTSVNASLEISTATNVPKIQQMYGPGSRGVLTKFPSGGWGPLIQPGETIYNNVDGFLQTGILHRYNASASGGNDRYTAYTSVSYSDNEGIVPEDYAKRFSILLKGDMKVSDNVKATLQANSIINKTRGFGNSMSSVYNWPINDDISNYRNSDGSIRWRHNPDEMDNQEKLNNSVSPLWSRYVDFGLNNSTRNLLMGSLTWMPINKLELTGRLSYDGSAASSQSYSVPRYSRSDFEYAEGEDPLSNSLWILGSTYNSHSKSNQLTIQGLATYEWSLTDNWTLNFLAGTEFKTAEGRGINVDGDEYIMPGVNSFMNTVSPRMEGQYNGGISYTKKNTAGFYGELRADYLGIAQISGTFRQDYTSTLAQMAYNYSSLTGGLIFTELFDIKNGYLTFGKLRGNWARVGKDTGPYKTSPSFTIKNSFPDPGYAIDPTLAFGYQILPEMTDSWEIGADLRFFENRTRLDLAYYSTTNDNQIVTVRVSPAAGSILQVRNEGVIKNHGFELSVDQDIIKQPDFDWTTKFNFSFNRGVVVDLPDEITELQGTQYGDIFPTSYLHGSTTAFSGLDYLRNDAGQILVNTQGYPRINPAKGNLIGNREPDFVGGLVNNLRYKDFGLNFLFSFRKGGDVANITGRSLMSSGMSKFHETYRNREFLFDGVVEQADGSYLPNERSVILDQQTINTYIVGVSSNFIEDGSYIRLNHVTLSWDLSRYIRNTVFSGLNFSVTGRNLLLLSKFSGGDPEVNSSVDSGGSGSAGISNFNVPSVRSYNITINASF